jgi:sarcosine oxidase gamma subunit
MLDAVEDAGITSDDDFLLFELAAWSRAQLDDLLYRRGWPCPPQPGDAAMANGNTVLRITPHLAWVLAQPGHPPEWQPAEDSVVVDLSNSRMCIHLRHRAEELLSRLVAVDLGAGLTPGAFTASMIHAVPVTILHAENGADLLVPRSFHASLLEWIADAARGLAAPDAPPIEARAVR